MNKVFNLIVSPFAIIFFGIEEFITGKPYLLKGVSQTIEDALFTRVIKIDMSNQTDNDDWKTYFITELKRKPYPADAGIVSKALNVTSKNIEVLQDNSQLVIAIPRSTLYSIQKGINKKSKIWFGHVNLTKHTKLFYRCLARIKAVNCKNGVVLVSRIQSQYKISFERAFHTYCELESAGILKENSYFEENILWKNIGKYKVPKDIEEEEKTKLKEDIIEGKFQSL